LLGKACLHGGDAEGARTAWQEGMAIATAKGDIQAAKEMRVFLARLGSTH